MNTTVRTFEDGSELTVGQLIGAAVAGVIVGVTVRKGVPAVKNQFKRIRNRKVQNDN